MTTTIAQITDLHITTGADPINQARSARRLQAVLAAIARLRPQPVAIVASGDLVDRGEPEEYGELQRLLAAVALPLYMGVGNHDRRALLLDAFAPPQVGRDDAGFIQHATETGGLRLIICDTLEEGHAGGGFCETRAAWLARTLDAEPDKAALVFLHHPPIASGIGWMDPAPGASWLGRLAEVVGPRDQVAALACGHVHRAFHGRFAGKPVVVAPATTIQLALDLTGLDPAAPDGRPLLVDEPPAFALHRWDGAQLVTHWCVAGDYEDSVRFERPLHLD